MKKFFIISFAVFFMAMNAFSAIWRVNNMPNSGADFTTLAAAVEAAAVNDIIYVEGSGTVYNESYLTITKKLTIYGTGYYLTENDDTQANHFSSQINSYLTIDAGAEGTILSGLNIVSGYLYVFTSDIIIERCYVGVEFRISGSDQHVSNLLVKQSYLLSGAWIWGMNFISSNLTFANNIINNNLTLTNSNGSYIVKNNIFFDQYDNISAENAVIQNNIVRGAINADNTDGNLVQNNIIGTSELPVGGTNNIVDVDFTTVFVDYPNGTNTSPDAMFELKDGSVAIGFGVNGVDCGIFDGDFPYILSGLPPLPRIYEATISGQGTMEGLHVIIKAKTQQ
jgi:hypothetical protein